ncbi:MFS transporter [Blastococcus sp. SYSU D00669]
MRRTPSGVVLIGRGSGAAVLAYAAGAFCSGLGNWMLRLGQALVVLSIPGTGGAEVGLVTALQTAPTVLLAVPVGTLADRTSRRGLLVAGQCVMATAAGAQCLVLVSGSPTMTSTAIAAVAFGCGSAVDSSVRFTFVSSLVEPARLVRTVGLVVVTYQLARTVGPSLAGALDELVGLAAVFVTAAALISTFAVTLGFLRGRPPRGATATRGTGLRRALWSVGSDQRLRTAFLVVAVAGLVGPNLTTLAVLMVDDVFESGSAGIGWATTGLAAGSLLGSLAAVVLPGGPSQRSLLVATAGCGLTAALTGLTPSVVVYCLVSVAAGATSLVMVSIASALVQVAAEDGNRGMITALFSVALLLGVPVGGPLLGLTADLIGARLTSVGAGLVVLVFSVVLAARRRRSGPRGS